MRGRSLKQALQAELAGHAPTRGSIASSRGVPSLLAAVQAVARRTSGGAPSRANKKGIVIYVNLDVADDLHRMAKTYGTTIQALGVQAIMCLFEKYA